MLRITDDCICCSACLPECPSEAIYWGDHAEIDPARCDECAPAQPACQAVCPMECIVSAESAP